jgi:hypothetical protein
VLELGPGDRVVEVTRVASSSAREEEGQEEDEAAEHDQYELIAAAGE